MTSSQKRLGMMALLVAAALGGFAFTQRHRGANLVRKVVAKVRRMSGVRLVSAASTPLPPGSFADYHPRILINRDLNLADLKARSKKLGGEFEGLAKVTEERAKEGMCDLSDYSQLTVVMGYAYMYQMTGKAWYADRVIDGFLRECPIPVYEDNNRSAMLLEADAIAFDWTYQRIVERGLKAETVSNIKKAYRVIADQAAFAEKIREADFHNFTVEFEAAWLMAGLALYGEDPEADAMIHAGWGAIAEGLMFEPTSFSERFEYKLKTSIDFTGGAMNWEGPLYWRQAVPVIVRALEAYDTASNRTHQVWKTDFSNTLRSAYYRMNSLRPDGTLPGIGDATAGTALSWKDNFGLSILMDRFKDGHIRRLIDITGGDFYGGYGTGIVFKLLFYDPSIKSKDFFDVPLSDEFGREVYLRSAWTGTASYLSFVSGSLGYFHGHLDENSFTVFRGADLATDGGYSLNQPYYENYFKRTVAHNAITVTDPKECWRDRSADCSLSNDGGQRWPLRRFSPPFTTEQFGINRLWSATILKDPMYREQFVTAVRTTEFQPTFDYIRSDASKAYNNQWSGQGSNTNRRVELAMRELVFVKPEFAVILDRVTSTQASFRKAWLLHSVNAPSLHSAGGWAAAQPGIHESTGQNEVLIQNGASRMLVKTLLPEAPKIVTIGGPGYEGWVNGKNYWTPELDKAEGGIGRWRIEVEPTVAQQADLFLHVLSIPEPKRNPESQIELLSSRNLVGALIHTDRSGVAVLFPRGVEALQEAEYTVAGAAQHILSGLAPGVYDIERDGQKLAESTASPQGCLQFRDNRGGAFHLRRR